MIERKHGRKGTTVVKTKKHAALAVIAVILVGVAGVAVAAEVASDQSAPPGDTVPAWVLYSLIGFATTITGALVTAIKILWGKLNEERDKAKDSGLTEDERGWLKSLHELHDNKNPSGVLALLDKLTSEFREEKAMVERMSDSKEERGKMREAFEDEKAQMRQIYTAEIGNLKDQLLVEQRERREETEKLWKQNNETTREVMSVTKDLVAALQQNSDVMRLVQELIEGIQ